MTLSLLFGIVIVLALAGLIAWAVLQIPMPAQFKKAIIIVSVIGIVLYLFGVFGLFAYIPKMK